MANRASLDLVARPLKYHPKDRRKPTEWSQDLMVHCSITSFGSTNSTSVLMDIQKITREHNSVAPHAYPSAPLFSLGDQ